MDIFTLESIGEEVVIAAHGNIDSNNADTADAQLNALRAANPDGKLILDADDLSYISSAGLRIILRIGKKEPEMRIINVSSDVYEIFEMTGFSEIFTIEKAYRKMSVDGCEVIGRGAKGAVYRYNGDTIVKVYFNSGSLPAIHHEREMARKAFVLGLPTAISYDVVRVGDKFGSVFELLDAKSYTKLINENPDNMIQYVNDFADVLKQLHETDVAADQDIPLAKGKAEQWAANSAAVLDEAHAEKLTRLVAELSDPMRLLHMDYHTNNLMFQGNEPILIDMDTLAKGNPIIELANVYTAFVAFGEVRPEYLENFLDMPRERAKAIWDATLARYAAPGTDLAALNEKIKVLAYARCVSHQIKRGVNTPDDRAWVDAYKALLTTALDHVETLEMA